MNLTPITTPVALTEETTAPAELRQSCAMSADERPVATTSSAACGAPVEMPMVPAARSPNRTPPIFRVLLELTSGVPMPEPITIFPLPAVTLRPAL